MIGWDLVAIILLLDILLAIFGGLFIHFVSGKQAGKLSVAKSVAKIFFAWLYIPKVTVVVVLLAVGLGLMLLSPKCETVTIETGKWYSLQEMPIMKNIQDAVCYPVTLPNGQTSIQCAVLNRPVTIYRYNLISHTIYTGVPLWYLDMGLFFIGFALVITSLLIASLFIVRAVNRLYESSSHELEKHD